MAYLNTCTELDDLGKGRFRHVHHIKPIAYLENGVYRLSSANVAAYADGTYSHAVLAANMGVRIGDDGKYAIHPTRELDRYVAFGGPQVKVGGKWTAVPFSSPTRQGNAVVWTRKQADLRLTHIGHGLKHEMWLKNGYVPEGNLIAVAVNLVGLTRSGSTLLADGVPVARIQAPVVYDAANTLDTRPIKWDITSRDGQPYIVYTLPDLAGMAAPVVDPTLILQPDAAAGKDTVLRPAAPTNNLGVFTDLCVNHANDRSLLEFDLSSIPAAATCTSATIYLYHTVLVGTTNFVVTAYSIAFGNAAWVEGTKNNAQAGAGEPCWDALAADGSGGVTTAWAGSAGCATSGTDYEASALGTFNGNSGDAVGTEYSTALTAARVKDWFGGDTLNYGLLLTYSASQGRLASSDHATASYRPKLVVEYTLPSTGGGMLLLGVG